MTQEEVSLKTGKKQSTIASKLRLRNLSDTVKHIIVENGLTEGHANALLKAPDEKMRLDILKKVIERDLNVAATQQLIDDEIRKIITKKRVVEKKKSVGVTDYRVAVNTIKKAIDMVKGAGVRTRTRQIEYDDYYEYVIKINK